MNSANRRLTQVRNLLIAASLLTATTIGHADTPVEVEILKFQFIPQEITIKPGTTVRWTNKEKRQYHSVWFEQAGDPEPGYFFPGEFYERTFDTPGVYPYHCTPHPEMTGTVRVE